MDVILCEHGRVIGGDEEIFDVIFAGPVSVCSCCLAPFGFINSGIYTEKSAVEHTWTPDLCSRCGGHYVAKEGR